MVQRKFICECESLSYLDVEQNVNGLNITITDDNIEENLTVQLSIKDAEELMDELHKVISQIERGKND
jgi:hypothetical protein